MNKWKISQNQRNWGWNLSYWYGLTPYKSGPVGNIIQLGNTGTRGDLVYYDYLSDGSVNHSAMVTGGNAGGSGYPAITQHTTDRINFLLKTQLQATPNMTAQLFHVVRTNY
jgi:hypothetical protein